MSGDVISRGRCISLFCYILRSLAVVNLSDSIEHCLELLANNLPWAISYGTKTRPGHNIFEYVEQGLGLSHVAMEHYDFNT